MNEFEGPLAEYEKDYRAQDYITMLRLAANGGAPESRRQIALALGCGRQHAKTVTTNLVRKGLIRLRWIESKREYRYLLVSELERGGCRS